jgi:hypothetical protein
MDIVKRLRKWLTEENTYKLLSDAADEIERLRVALGVSRVKYLEQNNEIERLRDALHDIQDMPDDWENDDELNLYFVVDNHILIATEALKGEKS